MKRLFISLVLISAALGHGSLEAAMAQTGPKKYTWVKPPIDKQVDCNGDGVGDCTVRCGEATEGGKSEPIRACCLVPERSETPKAGSDATQCVDDEKVQGG